MEELDLALDDAVLIIKADNTIEILVEDDDDEFAPTNKRLILAIANKLQDDAEWIEDLINSLDELLDRQYH